MPISEEIFHLAIEIIAATNDGDDLAPHHLKLVEHAVNGFLTDEGMTAFYELVENVRAGYQPPWFHGIEHLRIDQEGFVYWKNQRVEHYTPRWAYTEDARRHAVALAGLCKHCEITGIDVAEAIFLPNWEIYFHHPPMDSRDFDR
jgi:hypothetical protein